MEVAETLTNEMTYSGTPGETSENFFGDSNGDSGAIENSNLQNDIQTTIGNEVVFRALEEKLKQLNLTHIEKRLGSGCFGSAYQIEGVGDLPHEKLALKVNHFAKATTVFKSGDVNALELPENKNLNRTYALLTYDGKEVYCLDKIDKNIYENHIVVGHLSKAIPGPTLGKYCKDLCQNKEKLSKQELWFIGKQLAEAIDTLHQHRISHNDLHLENIFVELGPNREIQNIVVGDFGCSSVVGEFGCSSREFGWNLRWDWNQVGEILSEVEKATEKIEFKEKASFYHLLFDLNCVFMRGKSHLKGRNILSHPFFSEEYKEESERREERAFLSTRFDEFYNKVLCTLCRKAKRFFNFLLVRDSIKINKIFYEISKNNAH